jgi:hypothetical protein
MFEIESVNVGRGGQLSVARPPGHDTRSLRAPQAKGQTNRAE